MSAIIASLGMLFVANMPIVVLMVVVMHMGERRP